MGDQRNSSFAQSLGCALTYFILALGLLPPTCRATVACTAADAPTFHEHSKLVFQAPLLCSCHHTPLSVGQHSPSHRTSDGLSMDRNTSQACNLLEQPLTTSSSTQPVAAAASSDNLLTTLSVMVLFHNIVPRQFPVAWAAATTAAAWLWLAFQRLRPWLHQASPSEALLPNATSATAASNAAAATVGLSPAATAAAAATTAAGAAGTAGNAAWWQHGLLYVELLFSNALDAALLLGVLLLPVVALRLLLARLRRSSAAVASGSAAATPAAGEAMPAHAAGSIGLTSEALLCNGQHSTTRRKAPAAAAGKPAPTKTSSPIVSPGNSKVASTRSSVDSSGSGHSRASSSTGRIVLTEQAPIPPTTPTLSLAWPEGRTSAQQHEAELVHGNGLQSAASTGAAPTADSSVDTGGRSSTPSQSTCTDSQQDPSRSGSGSGNDGPLSTASSPPVASRSSLDLGNLTRGVTGRGQLSTARVALDPTRALYSSPLETVVISCKLGSNAVAPAAEPADAPTPSSSGVHSQGHGASDVTRAGTAAARPHQLGHGSSIPAQRQLRELVEAAVRQAVQQANVAVLSTSVTSFPGCVHVVISASLLGAPNATTHTAAAAAAGAETANAVCQASRVSWQQVVQQLLAAQDGANADSSNVMAREGLQLKHLLVQDAAGKVHCLWISPSALQAYAASAADGGSAASGIVVPSASPAKQQSAIASAADGDAYGESSIGSSAIVVTRSRQLLEAASSAYLSNFAIPIGPLIGISNTPVAYKPVLHLPSSFLHDLAASGAGLRIVVSTTGPALSSPAPALSSVAGGSVSSMAQSHLLVDHTLWPDSSSWPASGQVDLLGLLPDGLDAARLAKLFGPVLTVNLVASTPPAATANTASLAAAVAATAPLVVPFKSEDDNAAGEGCSDAAAAAAEIVQATMAAGIPEAGPAAVLDVATATPIGYASSSSGAMPSSVSTLRGEGPQSATGDGSSDPSSSQQASSADVAVGEHLLLQLPILLLPPTACHEVVTLFERMRQECGGDGAAATQQHLLPLMHDIAAIMLMLPKPSPSAQQQQPDQQGTQQPQQQLVLDVLGFLSGQQLDALAAFISGFLGMQSLQQLREQEQQQEQVEDQQHAPHSTSSRASDSSKTNAAFAPEAVSEVQPEDEGLKHGRAASAPAQAAGALSTVSADTGAPADVPADAVAVVGTSGSRGINRSSSSPAATSAKPATATSASVSTQPSDISISNDQAAKVMKQAAAAHQQALEAQRAAAATDRALQLALQQIAALSAAATQAGQQAAEAQAAAAAATERAAGVEAQAQRSRALQLISSPAGQQVLSSRGIGIWGLLSGSSRAAAAARAGGSSLLGGVLTAAAWPPELPQHITPKDVLLGFADERLEVQYRRMKALQSNSLDRAALAMQLVRQVVYVWRLGRLMFVSAGTGLSLVLLCKYEAVVLLPYLMMLLCHDFWIYHRQLLLCLSQIAAALTVGMIAMTEIYRNEWSSLLQTSGPVLLARPSMMLAWFYVVVPLLQQQTLPEQAISCVAQLVQSLLIYVFILKGQLSLLLVVPLLAGASAVSFVLSYITDENSRAQAVAAARHSLGG